jgi:hypothetical protein
MDDPEGTIPEGSVFFWRNRFGGTGFGASRPVQQEKQFGKHIFMSEGCCDLQL